jgi:hypothetical protein
MELTVVDASKYDFCSEFYFVEKTIDVVVQINGEDRQIRIEALHWPDSPTRSSTRAYIHDTFVLQRDIIEDGKRVNAERFSLWVDYDLPSTSGDSADDVLNQALWLLKGRCS